MLNYPPRLLLRIDTKFHFSAKKKGKDIVYTKFSSATQLNVTVFVYVGFKGTQS